MDDKIEKHRIVQRDAGKRIKKSLIQAFFQLKKLLLQLKP
jgi:hypothetical protein